MTSKCCSMLTIVFFFFIFGYKIWTRLSHGFVWRQKTPHEPGSAFCVVQTQGSAGLGQSCMSTQAGSSLSSWLHKVWLSKESVKGAEELQLLLPTLFIPQSRKKRPGTLVQPSFGSLNMGNKCPWRVETKTPATAVKQLRKPSQRVFRC